MFALLTAAAAFGAALAAAPKGLYGISDNDGTYVLQSYASDGTQKNIGPLSWQENIAQQLSDIDQANGIYYVISYNSTANATELLGLSLTDASELIRVPLPFVSSDDFIGSGQMLAAGGPKGQVVVGGKETPDGPYVFAWLDPKTRAFTKVASLPGDLQSEGAMVASYSPASNIAVVQLASVTGAAWHWINMTSGKTGSYPDCDTMQTIDWDPLRDAFIGVGLINDVNRTVVAMDAVTGKCTLLGKLEGYYIMNGSEAALSADGVLYTMLQYNNKGPYHFLAVNTTSSPARIISAKPWNGNDNYQLEYFRGGQ